MLPLELSPTHPPSFLEGLKGELVEREGQMKSDNPWETGWASSGQSGVVLSSATALLCSSVLNTPRDEAFLSLCPDGHHDSKRAPNFSAVSLCAFSDLKNGLPAAFSLGIGAMGC